MFNEERETAKAFSAGMSREQKRQLALAMLRGIWPQPLVSAVFDISLYSMLGVAAFVLWRDNLGPLWVRVVVVVVLTDGWLIMASGWIKGFVVARALMLGK